MPSSIYDSTSGPDRQMSGRLEAGHSSTEQNRAASNTNASALLVPRVGVIHNPRSHLNKRADVSELNLKKKLGSNIHIAEPGDRAALPQALAEFAANGIDLLAIDGGDGTVRDVLTCGYKVFGNDWPALAILPRGKTNALAYDLEVPRSWDLDDAIRSFQSGSIVERRPLAVTQGRTADIGQDAVPVFGFILGAGAFTKATQAGQSAHRLGAFNGLAVASTAAWALMQSVFASRSNPWRQGAAMEIGLGPHNAPLGHSGQGDEARRQILFASSLDKMPGGIKPFGAVQAAGPTQFKMLAIDQISRRTTALIPAIGLGFITKGLRRRGVHQLAVSRLTVALEEPFVMDGEAFPAGEYTLETGPELRFAVP